MERLMLEQDEVQAQRDYALARNAALRFGVDHYYSDAPDLPDREQIAPGTKIKLFDDVRANNGFSYRVIAPAPGRSRFTVYGPDGDQFVTTTLAAHEVVDRAPADAQEEPMPIYEDAAVEPEPGEDELTPAEMASLRLGAFVRIDAHSDRLFASGFVFKGVLLSLSLEAQTRYQNMDYLRNEVDPLGRPIIPYPCTFSSLDDTRTVTITSAEEIHMMYLTAVARVAEIVATGNEQKDYIRDENRTPDELREFADTRPLPSIIPFEP